MVNEVSTYGNGWLKYTNDNAKVIENKKHGQAMTNTAKRQQRVQNNAEALDKMRKLLSDDNYNEEINIFVTDRTVDGKTQSKQAGQTYDLGDIFTQLAAEGYIKDDDGQGFTMTNARSLGDAVAKANEKDSPFHKFFTRSKDSKEFAVNRELAIQFLEAAGYSRAKAPEPAKVEEPETPAAPAEPETPAAPAEPEKKPEPQKPVIEAHGNEKYSNIGLENTKQIVIDGLKNLGLVGDQSNVCLDFAGDLKPDKDGNYYKEGSFTVKVLDPDENGNVGSAHDLPDSDATTYKFKVDKDGNIKLSAVGIHRSGNIFHKREYIDAGKTNFTPNMEAAQELDDAK